MKGKIYIIGMGPGSKEQMTLKAQNVLAACDVIAGYTVYVALLKESFPEKEFLTTGMRREVERCRLAVTEALKGRTVAMVSSGDAGLYGMAGILLEVAAPYPELEVEVIPGVSAAFSGAALLGAPLIADTCLISLSNLLTPWEKIEKRLACAAQGDFCIALYNPASKKRSDFLQKACAIILQYQTPSIPAGIVRNIGRSEETVEITTLGALPHKSVDMFTTVIIGNSQTKIINNKMVTPRGYKLDE